MKEVMGSGGRSSTQLQDDLKKGYLKLNEEALRSKKWNERSDEKRRKK